MKIPVHILHSAYQNLIRLASDHNLKEVVVRLSVENAGMLGVDYKVSFDRERANDSIFELPDFKVVIHTDEVLYMAGLELDYTDLAGKKAFVFRKKT